MVLRGRLSNRELAIHDVLEEASRPLKLQDIHEAVEHKLGGEVSLHSVPDALRTHMKGAECALRAPFVTGTTH